MPAIPHARQHANSLPDQPARRRHVHHFGGAGIAHRPRSANHQDGMLIDIERGVFDAPAVIFRSVKDHRPRDKAILVARLGKITPPETHR